MDEMNIGNLIESTKRNVDIIFCIDGTGSMSPCIESIKNNAKKFYQDLANVMTEDYNSSIESLNIKVITFRDYNSDKDNCIQTSEWFDMSTTDKDKYSDYLSNIVAQGGGDDPENGLEALYLAMTTKWNCNGVKDRQIIVLFTDADAHELGQIDDDVKPTNIATSIDELKNTWNGVRPSHLDQSSFNLTRKCRRMVLYAPPGTKYEELADGIDQVSFVATELNNGLGDIDFKEVIQVIACSVA
ncbi:MAG: VWA domain-containing protein [Clostridia bacterium]|nr:VWA domain-containing protein [Clostridia bacterium]